MGFLSRRARNGVAVSAILALTSMAGAVGASGDARTISLYHIHTKETLTILYKKDGRYIPEALEKINWLLRDWRRNEVVKIDPKTIDVAWEMHAELGSQKPIHIICGYRASETNDMLRRTRGGQASQSQHMTGKAIDLAFPDIPIRQVRYAAMLREAGGVGYYPTSALPFVHIDSARVRSWPRMPHDELALLFPKGRSKFLSAEGRSLEPGDAAEARRRQPQLAQQVAQFFDLRSNPRKGVMVASAGDDLVPPAPRPAVRPERRPEPERPRAVLASLTPETPLRPKDPPPRLLQEPRPVERSSRFERGPSTADRKKLDDLVMLAALAPEVTRRPRLLADTGAAVKLTPPAVSQTESFVAAPAFDEDHPDELAYQPFPILPLLTTSASPDDPALVRMVHPDVAETFDMMDDEGRILPMRLRPGEQTAQLLMAHNFTGDAVDLTAIQAQSPARPAAAADIANRTVKTTAR